MQPFDLSLEIRGGICGAIWWPHGQVCGYPHRRFDVYREQARFSDQDSVTLRDIVEHILMENGGDFQNAMFTADTEIIATVHRAGKRGYRCTRTRAFPLSMFPSVADYVDSDHYSHDFGMED